MFTGILQESTSKKLYLSSEKFSKKVFGNPLKERVKKTPLRKKKTQKIKDQELTKVKWLDMNLKNIK
ncbi:hypothetical protein NEOC84_001744|nr:hypothetical protein [Neochlamydia sp. AcF84]